MKSLPNALLSAVLLLSFSPVFGACTDPEQPLPEEPKPEIIVAETGLYPNQILTDDKYGYIVNSGDNAIQRFLLSDPSQSEPAFIDLGQNQNPYSMVLNGDRLFIVNLLGNNVTIAKKDGTIEKAITSDLFDSPEFAIWTGRYLIVTNTQYSLSYTEPSWGNLVVIQYPDTQPEFHTVKTSCNNPQYITHYYDTIIVISSGGLDYANGISTPTSDGCVDFFDADSIFTADAPSATLRLSPMGLVGNPGTVAIADDVLYIGSGTSSVVFTADLKSRTWINGISNYIRLSSDPNVNGMVTLASLPDGTVYAADFNADKLHKISAGLTVPIETISLNDEPDLLLGVNSLATDAHNNLYLLNSLQRTVSRILR